MADKLIMHYGPRLKPICGSQSPIVTLAWAKFITSDKPCGQCRRIGEANDPKGRY
jgi:hypothetical protein